jgi:Bacterial Ig-like domain (group 3)
MNVAARWTVLCAGALLFPALLAAAAPLLPSAKSIISLDAAPSNASAATDAAGIVKGEASYANAPANFRSFASTRVGADAPAQSLTLHFAASTTLTAIDSTKDFRVVSGGTCATEQSYSAGGSCTLLVQFTPQGPGPRLGNVAISHTASAEPFLVGLGGNGYAPVVSFTPAVISTVPGTHPSGAGLLNGAQSLTVDGGDTLYIADTGNKIIRSIDSSGVILSLATTSNPPLGIAVDTFGEVYYDQPADNTMHEIYDYGPVVQISGTGTAACPASTPCNLNTESLNNPGLMSIDAYNHLFFVDAHQGAAMATVQPLPAQLIFLYDPFPYQTNPASAVGADASDNLYSMWSNGGECEIVRSSLYDAENSNVIFTKIVGGHTCGFSGDGGEAGNAEIGSAVGAITFDLAGNLYFSDTKNQRVRRIQATTGIISTIAGKGTAGYNGDGAAATSAELSSPTGVAADSQGQVYIISSAAATGTAQVVRKVGPNGFLSFGSQTKGGNGPAHVVTVTNTGNAALTITNAVITGTNPGDFKIDPDTTSCLLSPGSTLNSGASCQIGVLASPTAAGARSATLVLLDNTVTNSNTVQLAVTGTLPTPTLAITSPASGSSVKSGVAVKFAVSVTSSSSPAPTGTVSFKVDGVADGSPVALSAGTASVNVTESVTGTHTLSATYSGDANHNPAGPVSESYSVTAAAQPSKVTLTSSANPAEYCQTVDFTVTVAGASGVTPTGTVSLKRGTNVLDSASLSKGMAMLSSSTATLAVGTNLLTASYTGDAKNAASTSAAFSQVISPRGSACVSLPTLAPGS